MYNVLTYSFYLQLHNIFAGRKRFVPLATIGFRTRSHLPTPLSLNNDKAIPRYRQSSADIQHAVSYPESCGPRSF